MSLNPIPSSPFLLGQTQNFELQCWLFQLGDLGLVKPLRASVSSFGKWTQQLHLQMWP